MTTGIAMWVDLGAGCKILEVCYSFLVLQRHVSGEGMLEEYKNQRTKNRILILMWHFRMD